MKEPAGEAGVMSAGLRHRASQCLKWAGVAYAIALLNAAYSILRVQAVWRDLGWASEKLFREETVRSAAVRYLILNPLAVAIGIAALSWVFYALRDHLSKTLGPFGS